MEAQSKLDEMQIEDLTETRSQLSELEKTLDQFTTDKDSPLLRMAFKRRLCMLQTPK